MGLSAFSAGASRLRASNMPAIRPGTRRLWAGALWLAAMGALGWLLREEIAGLDLAAVWEGARQTPTPVLVLVIACTAISYLSAASYDLIGLQLTGRRIPSARVLRGGIVAVGLGQALGFGLVLGGFARWRAHRHAGIGPGEAAGLSAIVTAGFFTGLCILGGIAAALVPASLAGPLGLPPLPVQLAGIALLVLLAAAMRLPDCRSSAIRRLARALPAPRILLLQTALAALDVLPAALALWWLLPAGLAPGFLEFAPVFLVALALGLVSNAPGGLGVFEATLILAFPQIPAADFATAILVYRAFYFGLPLLAALGFLAEMERRPRRRRATPLPAAAHAILAGAARADSNLAHLGDKSFLVDRLGRGLIMHGRRGRSLIALGDPVGPRAVHPSLIAGFRAKARRSRCRPIFYRIDAASASECRAAGLHTVKIGEEAVIPLPDFSLEGSSRRELRRKVAQCRKAGVEIRQHAPGSAPLDRLAPVAAQWRAARRGGERGFSMGWFKPDYVARGPVFEAVKDGECLGFISVWVAGAGGEWSLDLIRTADAAPQGTVHALICDAMEAARDAGAQRFSLCMAPLAGLDPGRDGALGWVLRQLRDRGETHHGFAGLLRFKQSFRPDWEPRFAAVPRGIGGALALYDTMRLCSASPAPQPELPSASPSELVADALPAVA